MNKSRSCLQARYEKRKAAKVEGYTVKTNKKKHTQKDNSLHLSDNVKKPNTSLPGRDDTGMNETVAAVCQHTIALSCTHAEQNNCKHTYSKKEIKSKKL